MTTETLTGLIIRIAGNRMLVWVNGTTHFLPFPGRWRQESNRIFLPAPGDKVILSQTGDSIRPMNLLPRFNEFTRRASGPKPMPQTIAANLDLVVVVAAACEPETPFGLVDRLLVTASIGKIPSILVVNKTDLVGDSELSKWHKNYCNAVEQILFSSAVRDDGIPELKNLIKSKITLLAGASGVGKSTIANHIDPKLDLRTADISHATGKGRHTTSHSELHPVESGGWLTDTPGLRECAPWGMTPQTLQEAFPEIDRLRSFCNFRNCLHRTETGCAVLAAAGTNELPGDRYGSYIKLLAESSI